MRGVFTNKISRKMSCLSSRSLVIVWKVIICGKGMELGMKNLG